MLQIFIGTHKFPQSSNYVSTRRHKLIVIVCLSNRKIALFVEQDSLIIVKSGCHFCAITLRKSSSLSLSLSTPIIGHLRWSARFVRGSCDRWLGIRVSCDRIWLMKRRYFPPGHRYFLHDLVPRPPLTSRFLSPHFLFLFFLFSFKKSTFTVRTSTLNRAAHVPCITINLKTFFT